MHTKPTIETVLERIDNVTQIIGEFRRETNERLDKIERKISLLNDDTLDVRAEVRRLGLKVDRLEDELTNLTPTRQIKP
ncbi:MAG: hypothetical protein K1Y36_11410 [Blastocatellia bacterium]|nr:hypothetical protein [Blastocatellia bacterium]